jgi:NitT/TauT family transport system substrate-binding protein
MESLKRVGVALALSGLVMGYSHAETLKIASPIRVSWEGAVPHLGQEQGIFQKYGLALDIMYTVGGGETLQAIASGALDVGLSAGTLSVFGAFQRGAPLRIIGASSTGLARAVLICAFGIASPFHARSERQDDRLLDDGIVHQHCRNELRR